MDAPAPVGETLFFSLSEFDQAVFDKLSDKIKDKIRMSPEYKSLTGAAPAQPDSINPDDDVAF
jgi:hypothetical protein